MNASGQKNSAHFSGLKSARTIGLLGLLIVVLAIPTAFLLVKHQYSLAQHAASGSYHTYYVSKNGNDADGTTWTTAWNELNQINWSVINPGDTILIDGGTAGMTYTTTLTVGKSGISGSPITIVRSTAAGHNGLVTFFGGRSTPLPYCGQPTYTYQTSGVIGHGIVINGQSWIVVDGAGWHGITIYGDNNNGILTQKTSNDAIRNMELYDNGTASIRSDGLWYPFQPNIGLYRATNMLFEYMDIHDAGEDSFQPNTINNITIRLSWLHDARSNPNHPGLAYNQCNHNDGTQIYTGPPVSGMTYDQDILGPGHENDLILGNGIDEVDNVTLTNDLFIDAGANAIWGEPEKNWTVDHVTSFTQGGNNVDLIGSGNNITNSIFWGSNMNVHATSANNCMWNTGGGLNGQVVNPMFVTDLSPYPNGGSRKTNYPSLTTAATFDFSLKPGSPCAGLGSSITSVAKLISLANTQPTTTPIQGQTGTPATISTPIPSPVPATGTPTTISTPTPSPVPASGTPPPSPTSPPAILSQRGTSTPSPTSPPAILSQPGAILAKDTFQRPNQALWGTASDGHTWSGYDNYANTVSIFSIYNNMGQVSNGNGVYNAVLGSTATDAEVLFSGSMSSFSSTNLGAVLRWNDTNNWYKAYINDTTLVVQKKVNGTTTIIGSASFAATAGTSYTLRFRVVGTTLYAKVWQTGTAEPTNWLIMVTDTTFSSGFCGLRTQVASGVTANYTSFLATVPEGTPTPTPSPSLSPSLAPGSTLAQAPSPAPGSTLAQDTFQRPNQALWGTASDGHTWSGDANTVSTFSINNNSGQMVNGGTTSYSAVLGPSVTNAEVVFTGSMSSYTDNNLGAALRWTDGNNWYKAYINGTTLVVQKKVNGATTILGSVPFTATPGTSYTLRFRVVGTTLYAKVWQTGTAEPANWMIMVTDTTFSSGFCGLRMLAQNGTTASYTSFLATAE